MVCPVLLYNVANACRCTCTHCIVMPTLALYCKEIAQVIERISQLNGVVIQCITEHPGFATVCLDVYVLQTAYFQYHQQHGVYNASINE